MECIEELGYEAVLKQVDPVRNDECAYITITTDEDLEWYIYLGYTGPHFDEFEISAFLFSEENPHLEANNWHMNDHLSVVTVHYDQETGNPQFNNGFFTLQQRMLCVKGDDPLETFVENSMLLWEDEFDEFLAQLCPEISSSED